MRQMSLEKFAEEKGQTGAATALGMSQGALNKALRVGRKIVVTEHGKGVYSAEEVRPFPSQQPKTAAA